MTVTRPCAKTPYWLVVPLCTLAAVVAGNAPTCAASFAGWSVHPDDRGVLRLPMYALFLLSLATRVLRRYDQTPDAAGGAWRVLTSGCTLYLLGETFSWPLAILLRRAPMDGAPSHLFFLFVAAAYCALGCGVFAVHRRGWTALYRFLACVVGVFFFLVVFLMIPTLCNVGCR